MGLRRDQLSVSLTNPTRNGVPLNQTVNFPGGTLSEQVHGDFSSRLWIPYFGVEIGGQCYRASFLYSPFASANIQVPDVDFVSLFRPGPPSVFIQVAENFEFKVQRPTQFFEYNFEYNVGIGPNLAFQVWSTGTWMQLRGKGNVDNLFKNFIAIGGVPVFNISESLSRCDTVTHTRSMISGGIGAMVSF